MIVWIQAQAGPLEAAEAAARAGEFDRAEQLLEPWLTAHPLDESGRFLAARLAAWKGRYAQAIAILENLVAAAPANSDYRLALGRAYLWSGSPTTALPHVERARLLSPQDPDIWRTEIQIMRALGPAYLPPTTSLLAEARRRFPGENWDEKVAVSTPAVHHAPPPPARRWEGQIKAEYEVLTNGTAPWIGVGGRGAYSAPDGRRYWFGARQTTRFGLFDIETMAGMSGAPAAKWTGLLEAGFSPTHQVLPWGSVAGHLVRELPDGWNAEGRLRLVAYPLTTVPSATLLGEKYLGAFRLSGGVTAAIAADGSVPLTPQGTVTYEAPFGVLATIGLAKGAEVEAIAPGQVIRYEVTSAYLECRVPLPADWVLAPVIGYVRQGAFTDRYRVELPLRRTF